MAQAESGGKSIVLAVDDDPESLQLIEAMLQEEFLVRLAANGEQALKAANEVPRPDTVLLDIMMPGLDGYEVCRQLKANPATRDIPVILLTAKVRVEDAHLGFEVGCADYITKPIVAPLILARVRTHVALKQARDFLSRQSAI